MTSFDKNLAIRTSVDHLVTEYLKAKVLIEQGYETLAQAEKILENAFGETYRDFDTVDSNYRGEPAKYILDKIKKNAWHRFVDALDIRRTLSNKRADDLDKRLDCADELPEITVQNVFDTLLILADNSQQFAEESIREVFDNLRPRHPRHVTNLSNALEHIGRKIIREYSVRVKWGNDGYEVNHYARQHLLALDNVFHVLDGKVMRDGYQSPLLDAINTSGPDGKGETDYFKFKCYQNGNLHIEFRRLDLLKIFNAVAGGAKLKSGTI